MRLHRIDVPIWSVMRYIFNKLSIADFKDRTSKLVLSETGFKRVQFLNRYYLVPLAAKGFILGSLMYIGYETALSLPPVHNSKLKRAHEKRCECFIVTFI